MTLNKTGFRVGAFVIAGAAALLAVLYFLAGASIGQGVPYETYFQESVQGLDIGTAVKFRGVVVGQVTDVGLVSAEYPPPNMQAAGEKVYQQIVVRFRLNPRKLGKAMDIGEAVIQGLRAQIAPQGITGLSYIDLSFASPQTYPVQPIPWTPNSTVIPSIPSTLSQVQDALENILSSLSQADIGKMAAQVSALISTMHEEMTTGDTHQAIASAKELLDNLNKAVQQSDLPGTTASIRNLAGGPQTLQIISQLNQTTAQLAKITAQLPAVVAASQSTVNKANETTSDLQTQLLPILRNMKATTDNLRDLSAELSANPGQAILGSPPPPEGQK